MKAVVILLTLAITASSSPLRERSNPSRRFFSKENDPLRVKYLLKQNDNGELQLEDLTRPTPKVKTTESDLNLYLYTRENIESAVQLQVSNLDDLKESNLFDPNRKNYFIVHGWNNYHRSEINIVIKNAILTVSDANVFVADWSRLSLQLYPIAQAAVPDIGEYMGNFINQMVDHYALTPNMFRLAGHSLGAHIAGCAGAQVNGLVDYIVGLDPAASMFTLEDITNRLDESDAEFVQVIHTSTLGFESAIGHADYYPNGGSTQPGCGLDLLNICAHGRSYIYFAESILTGNFDSRQCESYQSYTAGECDDNHTSTLGHLNLDKSATGDYYLTTNSKSPFSVNSF